MRLVIDLQGAQGSNHARGIGRYSRELALAMAREARDHEVIVALNGTLLDTAESLRAQFSDVLPAAQVKVWHSPAGTATISRSPLLAGAEEVRAHFLASLKPDIVHVSSLFEGLVDDAVPLMPQGAPRLPVVATCYDLIPLIRQGEYLDPAKSHPQMAPWYYRSLQQMFLCEGLLAISESSRDEAIRYLPYAPERVFNIQAGISEAFRPAPLDAAGRAALLRRYGLRGPYILFLGAGDPRKNEAGLLAAYGRLPPALQKQYQLLIVGRIDEDRLRVTASSVGVPQGNIVVAPFVQEEDLNPLYSACSLFVFPSLHEGFGLPLAEAMACGAPCIASNTTSLPEVMGRQDATFDPSDADSIAARMRAVLENPEFRAELAAFGPVQARRFTWSSSANRAWDALEAVDARLKADAVPDVTRVVMPRGPRPSMAFVAPLPPQPSGIADYSSEVLPDLARHYDITLVTEADISGTRLGSAFPRLSPAAFQQQAGRFDRVLYQVGNSEFHRFQIETLLPQCPGVVVLHDAYLSNLANWRAHTQHRPDDFRADLLVSHSYPALRLELEQGRDAAVDTYPCGLPVLRNSVGVIMHSRHGRDVLQRHFGERATKDITIVPFLRTMRSMQDRTAARVALGLTPNEWVVCSFGGVTPHKCPSLVIDGWRRSGIDGRLVFAGSLGDMPWKSVNDPGAGISCTDRLTSEQYNLWLAAADMAVQWRKGSRGESSGAITDAMMVGLPTIINRHGTAAELPENVVVGLPDKADAAALAEALRNLRQDAPQRQALSKAGRAYVAGELSPEVAALHYRDVIEQAYATTQACLLVKDMVPCLQEAATVPGGDIATLRALSSSLPSPWIGGGHPRILFDISELARHDYGSGIQRVVREFGRRALEKPPAGFRGEAVRMQGGRLRNTYAAPLAFLGHAPLGMRETPADVYPGDVLICGDINSQMTDEEFAELRRLRLQGTRILVVIYDLLPMRHPQLFPAGITAVRQWYTRLLSIADGAICISRFGMEDLAAWLDENPSERATRLPLGYVHLGADFRAAVVGDEISPAAQAALDAASQRPTVIMTGTVEPRKGYVQALAAFQQLWDAGVDIGLTIIGKQGWQMEEFAEHARTATEAGRRLHWLSGCSDDDLRRIYRSGCGLLMASNHEGFGLPITEAALAGLPVLARDLPVFKEIAGPNARYFGGQDPAGLATALREWMEAGFTPPSTGLKPLDWDESYRRLCDLIEGHWHMVWEPKQTPPSHH